MCFREIIILDSKLFEQHTEETIKVAKEQTAYLVVSSHHRLWISATSLLWMRCQDSFFRNRKRWEKGSVRKRWEYCKGNRLSHSSDETQPLKATSHRSSVRGWYFPGRASPFSICLQLDSTTSNLT
nr:uncharacterized protein LOC116769425 [Danaus plexippus plexippus]